VADAGIQHVRYLDDFLIVASTAELAWASAHAAANILSDFGLALSPEKVEGPAQRLEFLGIVIDTAPDSQHLGAEAEGVDLVAPGLWGPELVFTSPGPVFTGQT
jgi:hypothetical protein